MLAKNPSPSRCLVRTRPNPDARLRLFCCPHAGAGASTFRLWPEALPAWVEVWAVQPPGRENRFREPPHTRLDPLVDEIAEAVEPLLEAPYALFGHSLGALVSFELARRLRRSGLGEPEVLIASGRSAPQLPLRRRPIHALPEAEFRDELRRLEGTPPEVLRHDELMAIFTPLIRADLAINETYAYREEPPLACPILAVGGTSDPWVDLERLDAWRVQTAAGFECRQLPGNHFYLHSAAADLLALITRTLERAGESRR